MARSKKGQKKGGDSVSGTGVYVYGIVPADVEVEKSAKGVGDPPARVEVIRVGDIAALVSPIDTDRPLGKPEDLQAHARLLDGTAAVSPVLPVRFGAVLTDADAVASELLEPNHDEFAGALRELEGRAQYLVKGRYEAEAIINEVVSESKQAQALREDIRGKSEAASRDSRIALGELISNAIDGKRATDTKAVVDEIDGLASKVNPRTPTHELDAVHVAMLVEVERQPDLEDVVGKLAENWRGRVKLRLLGPLAAYDFVVATNRQG